MELAYPPLTTGDWDTLEEHFNAIFELWISYFIKIAVFRPRLAIRGICVHRILCHLDWIVRRQNREDRNPAKILQYLEDINNFFLDN